MVSNRYLWSQIDGRSEVSIAEECRKIGTLHPVVNG